MPVPLVFAHRHIAYKIACGVLALAALLAIFGVISPGWYYVENADTGASKYSHLWISCQDGLSNCHGVSSPEGEHFKHISFSYSVTKTLVRGYPVPRYVTF